MSERRAPGGGADRRTLLRAGGGLLAMGLGGCGFRPLYGPSVAGSAEPEIMGELGAVRVALVQERFGQLVRRATQQRLGLGIDGPTVPARYELRVSPSIASEGVGVGRDGIATRIRYVASTFWILVGLGPPVAGIVSGVERSVEAYNYPPSQYFAADASREAAERRLAVMIAELVVTRVAVHFRQRAAGAAAAPVAVEPPPPTGRPLREADPFGSVILPGQGPVLR